MKRHIDFDHLEALGAKGGIRNAHHCAPIPSICAKGSDYSIWDCTDKRNYCHVELTTVTH